MASSASDRPPARCPWVCPQVCAHRLINAYSATDWILALVYRSSSLCRIVAGLQPIAAARPGGASNLRSVDVSHLVKCQWCASTHGP
mmetsp:Transcript_29469/g.77514  ORF Transcript_29469/g.77514 Transcript_29469/m.77514 type:complete len:87 (-) Transcript_29469:49-309(-)